MPRPKKERMIDIPPLFTSFKPSGVQKRMLAEENLSIDEYEAIRLADYLQMDHKDAACKMEISRPTFSRLLEKAHGKVAAFLIDGKELTIGGGNIHFRENILQCADCDHMFRLPIINKDSSCPNCGSTHLLDLAGGFGHGRCCKEYLNSKEGEGS